jgi:hypothetical protein
VLIVTCSSSLVLSEEDLTGSPQCVRVFHHIVATVILYSFIATMTLIHIVVKMTVDIIVCFHTSISKETC